MTRNILTNRQLLKELEKRLPEFTPDDFATLLEISAPYQEKMMKVIHDLNPQVHGWIQEKAQQLEKEKTDKEIAELKKSLPDQK